MPNSPTISRCMLLLAILILPTGNTLADTLRMATTTSTQNSGLLERLLPVFQKHSGIEVQVIAVGTGKALKMGRDGDVDIVMVHAREAELAFVEEGFGIDRQQFMANDFVLVGPRTDPASVASSASIGDALSRIKNSTSLFISRGDDSGTHKKELSLWQQADIKAEGNWYREAGQGMGKVLQMSDELEAYTLADRGTWLAAMGRLDMDLLFAGEQGLNNPYGIIAVNPKKYPDIHYAEARKLIDWITSTEGQTLIRNFRINGEVLFKPRIILD